jgi:hypothetical protein
MKLFNKTIDTQLFKQYPIGSDLSKQKVVAKIFNPFGRGTWYIVNSDPSDPNYLWAIVDLGYGAEVGSVRRSDLENYRGRFGLGFERDLSFEPINAEKLYNGLRQGKFYAEGGNVIDAFQIRTVRGQGNAPTEILTTEQEVKFKKGGKISESSNYIPTYEVLKVHTKDGKVFENIYTETAVISGIYVSDKPLREKNPVGKNQIELFKKGGIPKSAIYIPRYNVDFIETENNGEIQGNYIYGGVWVDMKKQFRLVEEAKEKGTFNRKNKTSKFEAIYKDKKISIDAKSLSEAKTKAIVQLKVPKTKVGLLSVYSVKDPMGLMYDNGGSISDSDKETLIYVNQILRRAVINGDLTVDEANSGLAFEIAEEEVEDFIDDDMEEMGSSDFGYMYKNFIKSYNEVKGKSFADGGNIKGVKLDFTLETDGDYDDIYEEEVEKIKLLREVVDFDKVVGNIDTEFLIHNTVLKFYKNDVEIMTIYGDYNTDTDRLDSELDVLGHKYKINYHPTNSMGGFDSSLLKKELEKIDYKKSMGKKDWLSYVKDNISYFDLEDESEDFVTLTTRENGNVGDEEYGIEDVEEAKSIVKKIKEKYPKTKFKIYTVDEFVYLELEIPNEAENEFASGGGVNKLSFEEWMKQNNIEVYKRTYYWVADDGGKDYMYSGTKAEVMKSLKEDWSKSSKSKSFRERRNEYLEKLGQKEADVWDEIGAESGSEIRENEKMLREYAEGVEEMLQKEGVGKGSFDQEDYDYFTDENWHLFNEFLVWNSYYEPEMTKTEKAWREKSYADPKRRNYVSNPKIISLSSGSKSKSTNYVPKGKIKQIVLEKDGKEIVLESKDVLNGVNLYEGGGKLKNDHVYFAKRFVKEVITEDGDKLKPSNGYWVKKSALKSKIEPKSKSSTTFKKQYKFEVGDIVWDKGNKSYGVVLNNFDNPIDGDRGEIRLDSDGMQTIFKTDKNYKEIGYNLVPYGSKEDTGDKKLNSLKNSAKRIIDMTNDKENKDFYIKTYSKLLKTREKQVGKKIAGSQKAKYETKMSKGGSPKKSGGIMILAKQIRKDGETWKSALNRAGEQLKNK